MVRMKASGSRPFGSWVKFYEERDGSRFVLSPYEELFFDRDRGFMTTEYDFKRNLLCVPKMCGDGRFWRWQLWLMFEKLERALGCRGVFFCTKRDPRTYLRVTGGELVHQIHEDGKTFSYILMTRETMNMSIRDYVKRSVVSSGVNSGIDNDVLQNTQRGNDDGRRKLNDEHSVQEA